jgi:hypothetical protein
VRKTKLKYKRRLSKMPQDNRMTDPRSVVRESEMSQMARENIPSNMDMGMDSMMPQRDMTDIDKVRLLMDMGLNEQDAIEAVVRERSMGTVRPEEFGGQQMQAPMPRPQTMGGQQMPQQLGALPQMPPQAPPPRPDMSGMSREQMDMLRRGIDPFAEGMVR